MENPKLSDCASDGLAVGGRLALISSTVNGRPPDTIPLVFFGSALERPGSQLAAETQRDVKKLRGQKDVILKDTTASMEFEESAGMKEVSVEVVDLSQNHGRDSGSLNRNTRISYASMVGKSLRRDEHSHDGVDLDPNKVVVLDEDCIVDREGKFPTIKFSERTPLVESHRQDSNNIGATTTKDTGKEGLFGPWMMVDTRRRRPQSTKTTHKKVEQEIVRNNGSQFGILYNDAVTLEVEHDSDDMDGVQQIASKVQENGAGEKLLSNKTISKSSDIAKIVDCNKFDLGKKLKAGRSMASKAVVMPMVEGQQASIVEHTNHSKVHAAVSIFEQGHEKVSSDGIVLGKNMGGKAKRSKENVRHGLRIHKPSDTRTISKPVLSEWVDNMNSQLDNFARDKELEP
ncbi:hypothetical protein V6N13_135865 [Hibiscus sabdariffa]